MPSPSVVVLHRRYWQRSILFPLWTQQFLLQLCGCVVFFFAISIFWQGGPKHGPGPGGNRKEQVVLGVFFTLYLSLLLATLGEIMLFCMNSLQPKGYLISQILKTVASTGVWATLILYPLLVDDNYSPRLQVAVGMDVVFAWLQIPMLSALVHAALVWGEEIKLQRERREQSAALQAAADDAGEVAQAQTPTNENTPLLAQQVLGYSSRGRSIGGGSRV